MRAVIAQTDGGLVITMVPRSAFSVSRARAGVRDAIEAHASDLTSGKVRVFLAAELPDDGAARDAITGALARLEQRCASGRTARGMRIEVTVEHLLETTRHETPQTPDAAVRKAVYEMPTRASTAVRDEARSAARARAVDARRLRARRYSVAYIVEAFFAPLLTGQFRFERPWAAAPAGGALRRRARMAHEVALAAPAGSRGSRAAPPGWRTWLTGLPTGLRVVSVTLLAAALMGPQSIHARDRTDVQGIDIVLTLDCSLSMQAGDIQPNRFDATKVVVDDFVRRRPNDRIGAVIFGREAYTLLPLTSDHEALRGMIDELQLGMIEGRGTAIGNAIGVSLNRLRKSDAKSKVVILFTDGDSNSGNVSRIRPQSSPRRWASRSHGADGPGRRRARAAGRRSSAGRSSIRGSFPINPELLVSMAARTGGEAFRATGSAGPQRSFHTILDRLERSASSRTPDASTASSSRVRRAGAHACSSSHPLDARAAEVP